MSEDGLEDGLEVPASDAGSLRASSSVRRGDNKYYTP